ncbi:MAG: twin-arginine translocation signal domain-containing protein [Thermoguttaceae bacterium]
MSIAPASSPISRRDFLQRSAAAAAVTLASPAGAAPPPADTPSRPTAPLAMWALTGTLDSDLVRRHLDAFREVGWGVVLYPRWGLELEYLGDAWFDRIRFIVQEAASRRMEVWLYDEFCWPSGHAKGLVTRDRPDLAAELLEVQPDGTSRLVPVPDSANLLLPEATQRFLELTHERYAAAIGEHFGNTVRAIFTDEPSLALQHRPRPAGAAPWQLAWSTAIDRALGGDFPRRLAQAGDLAAWSGWRDYWAAYTAAFHDHWVEPIALWCRAHNIAMTGHFLSEGDLGGQVAANGSLRRQLASLGIPGIDEISTRSNPARCEALTLAAIAELPGKERMVEVFALGPPTMKLETMCRMVDLCAACGVDRYIMAICPLDLRGGFFKREYLGIHGPQQPWFRQFAPLFTQYVAEAAARARQAQPLGISWPADEELWALAGPDPKRSPRLQELTKTLVDQARTAIIARLPGAAPSPPAAPKALPAAPAWAFSPQGSNSLRIDQPALVVRDLPRRAALSVQLQLVRTLEINGTAVDLQSASVDTDFDSSYRRVDVAGLLRAGENRIAAGLVEPGPLKFLPALVLWGDFAVDPQGHLVAPSETIPLGDWRLHGYPAFCGTGAYRATVTLAELPTSLVLDTGGYPASVTVNGVPVGVRAWSPFRFDVRRAVTTGRNEIIVQVTGTLGHLFTPAEAPPIGLLAAQFE